MSEKIQLEQKLKLQRVELQKQANLVQSAEDKTRAELHELQVRAGVQGWEPSSCNVFSLDGIMYIREYPLKHSVYFGANILMCLPLIPSQCLPLASSAEQYAGSQPGHYTELLVRPPGGLCDV